MVGAETKKKKINIDYLEKNTIIFSYVVQISRVFPIGSVVEWLEYRTNDQHGLGSNPTCAILLRSWERHFTALSPAWWS